MSDLVGATEVAEHFGVTRTAVYQWVNRMGAPHESRKGRLRFDISELEQWRAGRINPARKKDRNEAIRAAVAAGEAMQSVGDRYGISRQRVEQIVHRRRHLARNYAHATIDIPEGQECERCEDSPAVERHHPDYGTPDVVEFVCIPCHRVADRERHEEEARDLLGVKEWEPIETQREAATRVGTEVTTVREGVEAGVIRYAEVSGTRFMVPEEVDAWVAFYRRRSDIRRRANAPSHCPQGHLRAPWNIGESGDGHRYCKACNSESARGAGGGYSTTLPTQYDVCLALHLMGCEGISGQSMRITARHPTLGAVKITRGGQTRWIIRVAGTEIGRADTTDGIWNLLGESDAEAA